MFHHGAAYSSDQLEERFRWRKGVLHGTRAIDAQSGIEAMGCVEKVFSSHLEEEMKHKNTTLARLGMLYEINGVVVFSDTY